MTATQAAGWIGAGLLLGVLPLAANAAVAAPPAATAAVFRPLSLSLVRVSVSSAGAQGNRYSDSNLLGTAVSANGRYVAFESEATNLVPGDTNGAADVFVRDLRSGRTERVSVDSAGRQGNYYSGYVSRPSISADGRYVAFESEASNLRPHDNNGFDEVFVHDRRTGATESVSIGAAGHPLPYPTYDPVISGNGRYVAFSYFRYRAHGPVYEPALLRDRVLGATEVVSRNRDDQRISGGPAGLSFDGNKVLFGSNGQLPKNWRSDYPASWYMHNRTAGTTREVSRNAGGPVPNGFAYDAAISADGRWVAFGSFASNLLPGDTPGTFDVFLRDLRTGTLRQVSTSTDRKVTGALPNDDTIGLSGNGRYTVFTGPDRLDPTDTDGVPDVYLHDRIAGTTTRISVTSRGGQPNSQSTDPTISADGHTVVFTSRASNLVPGDTNNADDVYAVTLPH